MASHPQAHPHPGHKPAALHLQPKKPEPPAFRHLLNLPNFLTLCRLGSVPIFLTFLSRHRYTEALWVFGAAALTDSLDGTVARLFDSRTELGAYLDPFADKLMLLSAFVVLTLNGDLPGYLLSVVLIRDVVIVVGYVMVCFFSNERVPVTPSYIGKISTFLQLCCVVSTLAGFGVTYSTYVTLLMELTVAVTAASGVHYMYLGLVWLRSREPEMFKSS
jgi:cardiolipin synthase (CMP-forming)